MKIGLWLQPEACFEMPHLQQYKPQDFNYTNQLILMDFSGKVVQSCNSIFDTFMYHSKSIVEDIPFLESIFHIVKAHIPGSPEILFKKVEKFSIQYLKH